MYTIRLNKRTRNFSLKKVQRNIKLVQVGRRGEQGLPGEGVPTGGTTGQVLKKASNTDYDTQWANESGGGGGGGGPTSADQVSFDDTWLDTNTGGAVTGDDVQEIIDNFAGITVMLIGQLLGSNSDHETRLDNLEASGGAGVEDYVLSIEQRPKYALCGGGYWGNYDTRGFELPKPGEFADNGCDIYIEYVPITGTRDPNNETNPSYQELFTIEDPDAWGGDLLEAAIVHRGGHATQFFELTSPNGTHSNGYGEDPNMFDNGYTSPILHLVRVRYTLDPVNGLIRIWRPTVFNETPTETAHGVGWVVSLEVDKGGAYPLALNDSDEPWKIGKGSGRFMVSRVKVHDFAGTPMADFDPATNMIDATTVYDPVADDNWVVGGASPARIIDTETFMDNWLDDTDFTQQFTDHDNDIAALQDDVTDLQTDVTTLQTDVTAVETDISEINLELVNLGDMANLLGDTDTAEIVDAYANGSVTEGLETAPATELSSSSARDVLSNYTMPVAGKLTSVKFLNKLSTADTMKTKILVYSDNAGAPDALLAVSDELSITNTTATYNTYTFTGVEQYEFTDNEVLWIGSRNESVTANYSFYYTTDATKDIYRSASGITYADPIADPSDTVFFGTGNFGLQLTIQYKKLGKGVNVIGIDGGGA